MNKAFCHYYYNCVKPLDADTSKEDLIKVYSKWSEMYDKDAVEIAYIAPELAADHLTEKLKEFEYSKDARILDLGCGTGLGGEQLYKRGYYNIDGIDLCPEILEVARKKGVYKSLQEGRMMSDGCKDLGVAADQYDAAVCIGVFTGGHVKGRGLDDLVHVVKPGGLMSFSIAEKVIDDPQYGYHEKMNQLCEEGKWKQISKRYEPRYSSDRCAWFYVYQVL